jgi:hypothetical protein
MYIYQVAVSNHTVGVIRLTYDWFALLTIYRSHLLKQLINCNLSAIFGDNDHVLTIHSTKIARALRQQKEILFEKYSTAALYEDVVTSVRKGARAFFKN